MATRKVKKMFVEVDEPEPEGIVVALFEGTEIRFAEEEFQAVDDEGKGRYREAKTRIGRFLSGLRNFYLDGAHREMSPFKIHALQAKADGCRELYEKVFKPLSAEAFLKRVETEGPVDMGHWLSEYGDKRWEPTADMKPGPQDQQPQPRRRPRRSQTIATDETLFELPDEGNE